MLVCSSITLTSKILTIVKTQINGVFPFPKLPIELQNKIIGYAMLAVNHEIAFPCLTDASFTPGIAVGLLSVK